MGTPATDCDGRGDCTIPADRWFSGVTIGAGAKIIGNVKVGDSARIGTNAVVIQDVPAGATAVGVPARNILPGLGLEAAS